MAKPNILSKGETQTGRKNDVMGSYLEGLVPEIQKSRAKNFGERFNERASSWTKKLQRYAPSVDDSEASKHTALYKAFLQDLPEEIDVEGRLVDSNKVCRLDPKSTNPINPAVVHNPQNKQACVGRLLPGIKDDAASVCKKATSTGSGWSGEIDVESCKGRVLTFPLASLDRYSYAGQALSTVLGQKVATMMGIWEHGKSLWHENDDAKSFHLEVWGAYKIFADMDKNPQKQSFYINWILRLRLFSLLDVLQSLNERQAYLWDSFLRALGGLVTASTSLANLTPTKSTVPKISHPKMHVGYYRYEVKDPRPPSCETNPQQQVFFCKTQQEYQDLMDQGKLTGNMLIVETQWLPERLEGILPDNESRSLDIINFLQYLCTIHKTETEIFQGWWSSDSHILLRFWEKGPETSSNPSKLLNFLVAHVLRMAGVSVFLVPLLRMDPQKRFIEHLIQATMALETWGGIL